MNEVKEINKDKIEKNKFGVFSNIENDYKYILKGINNKKKKENKSFNKSFNKRVYKISNEISSSKKNNVSSNKQNINKSLYSSEKKKNEYYQIPEYPFKNIKLFRKNNEKINKETTENKEEESIKKELNFNKEEEEKKTINVEKKEKENIVKPIELNELYSLTEPNIKEDEHYILTTTGNSKNYNNTISSNLNRYMTEYFEGVEKKHCSSYQKLEFEKLNAPYFYKNNMKNLENWIFEIKENTNEKKIVDKKKNISQKLSNSVNKYQDKIFTSNKLNEKILKNNEKYNNEINKNKKLLLNNKNKFQNQKNSINEIKTNNKEIINQNEKLKEETRFLKEQIKIENNKINQLNKQIQKMNNLIFQIKKEKENKIKNLNFINKQKEMVKDKINKQFEKNSNFMLEVNELLNKSKHSKN